MRRFAALALLVPLLLAGCAATGPLEPADPSRLPADAPAEAAETAEMADPELAAFVGAIAGHSPADPEALVDAVEAAGFARSSIERTRERDSLGEPVTFLQIAVLTEAGCIIGEVGAGDPRAVRTAPLGGGRCLVGEVVALD